MLRRWLTHRRLCFGAQTREELPRHHLRRPLDHALAHARDRSSNLHVAHITNLRTIRCLLELEIAGAFEKSRLAFAVNNDAQVFGLAHIFESRGPIEDTFDRSDAGAYGRGERVLRSL